MSSIYHGQLILVTGGGGFIGRYLVDQLLSLGAKVRIAQRTLPHRDFLDSRPDVEYVRSDLLSSTDCQRSVSGVSSVFHLAADVRGLHDNENQPASIFHNNICTSLNLLRACQAEGVTRLMLASSNSIYSSSILSPNREEDGFVGTPDPSFSAYGWAKRVMELAGQYYVKEFEMEISIARIGNVYGPGMRLDEDKITVIPALIEKIFRSNNSIEVWGDGQQIRSFIYVQDVVEALLLLAEKCHLGEPTNISSGEGISIKTLITEILDITGANLEINFNESMPTGKPKKVESVSKRRERLGWQPKFTIREGLQKTIEWYREQQIFLR